MSWNRALAALLAAAALAATGAAQTWSDDLESYADGSPLDGQGGWQGWDGNDGYASVVTSNLAFEGAQSVRVAPGADSVRPLDGFGVGRWRLTVEQYVPSWFAGRSYLLVLNRYEDGGPYEWGVQLSVDGDALEVRCDCGATGAQTMPLLVDQWVELRCDIDLELDQVDVYYAGQLLGSYPWSQGVFGGSSYATLAVEAIDLYPDVAGTPLVTEVWYDDFRLEPWLAPVGAGYCPGDGTGALCPCGNVGQAGEGCANTTGAGGLLTAGGSNQAANDTLVFTAAQLLPNQPALLFVADNQVAGGAGTPFGDGLRCAGGNLRRLGVKQPDAAGVATFGPGLQAAGGWTGGDVRRFQAWYRDPGGSPCGTGFNLTNGHEIHFLP